MLGPYRGELHCLKKKEQYVSFYIPAMQQGTSQVQFAEVTDPAVTRELMVVWGRGTGHVPTWGPGAESEGEGAAPHA